MEKGMSSFGLARSSCAQTRCRMSACVSPPLPSTRPLLGPVAATARPPNSSTTAAMTAIAAALPGGDIVLGGLLGMMRISVER